jgi:hypothetical protein
MAKKEAAVSGEVSVQQQMSPMRFAWWGLAALSLVVGYADLARGGEALAPVLLVLGYCVFVPLAILK